MLGLLLIYFAGKAFYNLAHEHGKHQWGFAILGVVSYYAGTFFAGIIIGILSEFGVTDVFNEMPDLALGFVALPFGVLTCWGLYKFLENRWENEPKSGSSPDTLDGDFIQPNP